jgi:hypothetical protein
MTDSDKGIRVKSPDYKQLVKDNIPVESNAPTVGELVGGTLRTVGKVMGNSSSSSSSNNESSSSSSSSSSEKCIVIMETKREESASYKNWRNIEYEVKDKYGKSKDIDFYYDPTSGKYKTSITIMNTSFNSLNDVMQYLMELHHGCSTFKKD